MAPQIKTLTIQEVSRRCGVSTHTLRFWEKELEGVIVPQRTTGGQRRYTMENLLAIEEIKRFKTQGMTLADIRHQLNNPGASAHGNSNDGSVDLLADRVAEIVRSAICKFFQGKLIG
jgi:DNA-binding transcriptional MerR regulator